MSACAFLDEETGKVIVGFTDTNKDKSILHGVKDWVANANIALSVRDANDPYYESTQESIKKIEKTIRCQLLLDTQKVGMMLNNNMRNILKKEVQYEAL
ncbi:hypothetical protein J9174_09030 [Macrococcoides canis]|uniref:hypothetical protein n=1 Tax=Macrococcoides canis TaxID=1855823 RepID=UPI001AEC0D1D|nr:hypothetical protein [Macrococcus canis]QTQ07566.1 hypothetical protein J9174_09030 [Macrococcus canis]